jgi:predicted PurR-regulated permease PerM
MEDVYFRKIMTSLILFALILLSFFLVKPLLLSIVSGVVLAFIFTPVYNYLYKKTNSARLSAYFTLLLSLLIIVLPLWFLIPIFMEQFFKIYFLLQQLDILDSIKEIFPTLFALEGILEILESVIDSFMDKIVNLIAEVLTIDNILNYSLKFLVVFFIFFFALKDKDKLIEYIKSLLPFPKDIENRLFEYSREITYSVIYGQILIGIIQGMIIGIGFFIFNVPNALILTLLAILAGIFPIVGTALIWIPIVIYLLIAGSTFSAFGIIIFGFFSSSIDNFLRPLIISKKTCMNSAVVLVGMIGGFFLFGILGFILGPLILAYLFIILELYRNKKSFGLLTKSE